MMNHKSASANLTAVAAAAGVPGPETFQSGPSTSSTSNATNKAAVTNKNPNPKPTTTKTTTKSATPTIPIANIIKSTKSTSSSPFESESIDYQPLSAAETEIRIVKYQQFIDNKLKPDLKFILDRRNIIYDQLSEWLELRKNILLIQSLPINESMKSLTNIGCDIYVNTVIPKPQSELFIMIGLGFYVQLTPIEALEFIKLKETVLQSKADKLTNQSNSISSQIKLITDGIGELMQLTQTKTDTSEFHF